MFLERPSHSVNLPPRGGAWCFITVNDPHGTVKVPFRYGHGIASDCGSVGAASPLAVSETLVERANHITDILSHNQPPLLRPSISQHSIFVNLCQYLLSIVVKDRILTFLAKAANAVLPPRTLIGKLSRRTTATNRRGHAAVVRLRLLAHIPKQNINRAHINLRWGTPCAPDK